MGSNGAEFLIPKERPYPQNFILYGMEGRYYQNPGIGSPLYYRILNAVKTEEDIENIFKNSDIRKIDADVVRCRFRDKLSSATTERKLQDPRNQHGVILRVFTQICNYFRNCLTIDGYQIEDFLKKYAPEGATKPTISSLTNILYRVSSLAFFEPDTEYNDNVMTLLHRLDPVLVSKIRGLGCKRGVVLFQILDNAGKLQDWLDIYKYKDLSEVIGAGKDGLLSVPKQFWVDFDKLIKVNKEER